MIESMHFLVPSIERSIAVGPFRHTEYRITRPWISWFDRRFHVWAPDDSLVAFVKHPVFRLKERMTIYADESEQVPLVHIQARQAIALNFIYDVEEATTKKQLGSLRVRGLRSILRDTWEIRDAQEQEVGKMTETGAAFFRRMLPLMNSKHAIQINGTEVAWLRQKFRFFSKEFNLTLADNGQRLEPRFAIACSLLALLHETRREKH